MALTTIMKANRERGLQKISAEQRKLLDTSKLTPFQRSVYTALCQVPQGRVTTYKHLASSIDCGSNQAVGQALKRNPYAPVVPCHRVVASDGSIGGFGGCRTGDKIDKKIRMLQDEGVKFNDDGTVDSKYLFKYTE